MNMHGQLVNRHSHIVIILLSVMLGITVAAVVMYYPRAHVPVAAQDTAPQPASSAARALEQEFIRVADQTLKAVVSISVETSSDQGNIREYEEFFKDHPFFEPFFREFKRGEREPRAVPRRGRSLGSGWVFREDGYIVTNAHVVRGAQKIAVRLYDKPGDEKQYDAELVGTDPRTELAVIKVDAGRKLPALKLGNSGEARVGQWVMAVGAPFQLDQTVTAGIISAKGRFLPGQSQYIRIGDIIQTDASINPGNSGGPLVNLDGEVVGINVAIVSSGLTPGNVGIGFAVPSDTAASVVPQLIDDRRVARGWLGITIADLNDTARDFFGVPGGGVSVEDINPDAPAAKSDLKPQDVIVAVDGEPVAGTWELQKAISGRRPGATITLDIVRDRKPAKAEVQLGEMPDRYAGLEEAAEAAPVADRSPLGVAVEQLTRQTARTLGLDRAEGVVVTGVEIDGPALGKLNGGDIILRVNRTDVKSIADFERAVEEAKKAEMQYVMVFYQRKEGDEWTRGRVDIEPAW